MNLHALTDDVQRLTFELSEASADVALLTRLKDAVALSARLTTELATAQDRLATGMADKIINERNARFASYRDVSIRLDEVPLTRGNVLLASIVITYEALAYDDNIRESVFVTRTVEGFSGLPSEVYEYILEVKPHELPAMILDLAPGDPLQAMQVYHIGQRRGFLTQ